MDWQEDDLLQALGHLGEWRKSIRKRVLAKMEERLVYERWQRLRQIRRQEVDILLGRGGPLALARLAPRLPRRPPRLVRVLQLERLGK